MSKFKQYIEIINELKVNNDSSLKKFLSSKIVPKFLKNPIKKVISYKTNKDLLKNIKSEELITKIKKLLESEHVQNNHFSWNNSGSKYILSPNQIIEEIKNSEIRPKGKITTLGPTGTEFKSELMRIISKNQVGLDYSVSSEEEQEAIKFYFNNKDVIDEAFSKIKQGLQYAVPIKQNGKIIYFLEKRHGNPHTKFFLLVKKGKPTKFINLIPDGKGGWFTSYPGNPSKVINFSHPAVLAIDTAERIKNTSALKIEFEKAIRMQNIKNFIELISNLSKDKNKFPSIGDKESFEKQTASLIKKELPANTKNINYILSKYNEIKKDLQEAGYIGDKIINQFMVDYKNNNKSEKEKIDWFYENYINKNPKIKMIFNS